MDIKPEFLKSVRAVVTDMDGTIFKEGMKVPRCTFKILAELDQFNNDANQSGKQGLMVIPATGRSLGGVQKALSTCDASGKVSLFPGIYLNGGLTYGPGGAEDIVYQATIDNDVLHKILAIINKVNDDVMSNPEWEEMDEITNPEISHGFYPTTNKTLKNTYLSAVIYSGDPVVCESMNQLIDGLSQFEDEPATPVGSMEEYFKDHPASKILVISYSKSTAEKIRPQIEACCGNNVDIVTALPRVLEIMPKGVNKSVALSHLCKKLNISMNQVFAIGDGENDYELLKNAGFSVAMKEGSERLKSVATHVAGSVNENGWGIAVETFLAKLREANNISSIKKFENRSN